MIKTLITALTIIICSIASLSYADSEWLYYSETDHWYKIFTEKKNWSDAQNYAASLGGYLATVTSVGENDYLYDKLYVPSGTNSPWLGGYQPPDSSEPLGDWQWVTGELWDWTNWDPDQPDDAWGGQDGLVFTRDKKWDDLGLDTQSVFIVESNSNPIVPEPISSILFITGGTLLAGRRYMKRKKKA